MRLTRGIAASAAAMLSVAALAGCADDQQDAAEPPERTAEVADMIEGLPDALASQYEGATSAVEVSPFADFAKVEGPWKVCYADSFQGNAWRVAVSTELERLASQYEEDGLVSGFDVA